MPPGPAMLGHGTTVARGIQILASGELLPSLKGKTGAGIYGFMITNAAGDRLAPSEALGYPEALRRDVWQRAATGGYNAGCVIAFEADGVFINKVVPETKIVPAGAISVDGDQFAVGYRSTMVSSYHILWALDWHPQTCAANI